MMKTLPSHSRSRLPLVFGCLIVLLVFPTALRAQENTSTRTIQTTQTKLPELPQHEDEPAPTVLRYVTSKGLEIVEPAPVPSGIAPVDQRPGIASKMPGDVDGEEEPAPVELGYRMASGLLVEEPTGVTERSAAQTTVEWPEDVPMAETLDSADDLTLSLPEPPLTEETLGVAALVNTPVNQQALEEAMARSDQEALMKLMATETANLPLVNTQSEPDPLRQALEEAMARGDQEALLKLMATETENLPLVQTQGEPDPFRKALEEAIARSDQEAINRLMQEEAVRAAVRKQQN